MLELAKLMVGDGRRRGKRYAPSKFRSFPPFLPPRTRARKNKFESLPAKEAPPPVRTELTANLLSDCIK